jgi:hypothetical protein
MVYIAALTENNLRDIQTLTIVSKDVTEKITTNGPSCLETWGRGKATIK